MRQTGTSLHSESKRQLLFSGSELLDEIDSDTLKKISGIASAQSASLEISGKKWLCISCLDDRFGMQLVSFCPMQQIDTQISFILKSSLLLGHGHLGCSLRLRPS